MPENAIDCAASAERVWGLIARPEQWHHWSPYVAGAEGLGSPEVEQGAKGKVLLRGGVSLPAEITAVVPGSSWSWRVGGIVVHHRVTPTSSGCRLEMPVEPVGRRWKPAATLYAPVVGLIMRRIGRVAA